MLGLTQLRITLGLQRIEGLASRLESLRQETDKALADYRQEVLNAEALMRSYERDVGRVMDADNLQSVFSKIPSRRETCAKLGPPSRPTSL